jgi:hypothetical protein
MTFPIIFMIIQVVYKLPTITTITFTKLSIGPYPDPDGTI